MHQQEMDHTVHVPGVLCTVAALPHAATAQPQDSGVESNRFELENQSAYNG